MSVLDRATHNSNTLFANLGVGQGSLFILDNDFAWPPYEWSKVPDIDTGKHFRIMPYDFNGKEWLESIEPKHFRKTPYWMQKHVSMWQDRDIWLFGCSFHGNVDSGIVALFLEAYRSRVDNQQYMLIASTSSEYIQHFASMWQVPGRKAWWNIISSGDAQTTEQYGAYWLHELWSKISIYEGHPPLDQYKDILTHLDSKERSMILIIVAVILILGGASICAIGPFAFDKEPIPSILMILIGLIVMLAGIILVAPVPI